MPGSISLMFCLIIYSTNEIFHFDYRKNINCSIEESLERFEDVMTAAREKKVPVRGYVSCVLGCPYEGKIKPDIVANVSELYSLVLSVALPMNSISSFTK